MKLMIASDIHGDSACTKTLLEHYRASGARRLILLGDILYHGPRNPLPAGYAPKEVIALLSQPEVRDSLFCVRGNCDTEVDQMVLPFPILSETALLFVDGRVWFAAHGHRAVADPTADDLPPLEEGSVFLSGHTHIPVLEADGKGILRLNPGSVSLPKGGFPRSYALYEDGLFRILSLEGEEIIREMQWS